MTILLLMIGPGWLIFAIMVAGSILSWIFWPEKGLLARFYRIKNLNYRVLIEDALKYLFDCEYRSLSCDMNSVAGNLSITSDKATALLGRLHDMGLIAMKNHAISLTDTGRSYSLRVIRVHRIWERYLADETNIAPTDWHKEADWLEHRVTSEYTEKLAARIGNPVFDPHGDPIPTSRGELPAPKGQPLNCLNEGEIGRIIHIEDEPRSIYEQLVVLGLYPGMQVYILKRDEAKVTFAADGVECVLTPLFAAQITVEPIPDKASLNPKYISLSSLKIGEKAEIAGISPNCRGQQRRRLMDLGIVPGSSISAEMKSASGDPVGYRVMGATIGIRKKQADLIFIHKNKNKTYEHSA